MNNTSPNPFIVGNTVGGTPAFVGRAAILEKVDQCLRQPVEGSLVLFGNRRIGKSSVLHQLRARLPSMGPWDPVFFDLQGRARMPLNQILWELGDASAGTVPFPLIPSNITEQVFRVWFDVRLRALAPGRRLVFLFDEIEVLTEHDFGVLLDLLGGERSQQIATVYTMGPTRDGANRLLSGATLIPVSTLGRREFELLLDLGELSWGEGTRDVIWEVTGGHPLLTQLIGSTLWHAMQQSEAVRVVSVTMVQEVIKLLKGQMAAILVGGRKP